MITNVGRDHRIRYFSPGAVFCLLATLLVLAAAAGQRFSTPFPLIYGLAGSVVVAQIAPDGGQAEYVVAGKLDSVRNFLRLFSTGGDARFLRYAVANLQAISPNEVNSIEVHLLRARILQSQHHFIAAADILHQVVRREPNRTEAWLLLSDASRRAGNINDSRRACIGLALNGATELATWCAVPILQSTGDIQRAWQVASESLHSLTKMPESIRRWSLEIAADAAFAAGLEPEAVALYERAIASGESPLALRLTYSDALLRLRQHQAVVDLLKNDHGNIGALIRLAIAARGQGVPSDPRIEIAIEESFGGLSRTAIRDVRIRDKAIYELYYKTNKETALEFALANWQQQKGSEDFALLREAAIFAENPEVQEMLTRWQSRVAKGLES